MFNLSNTIIGAGIMGLPAILKVRELEGIGIMGSGTPQASWAYPPFSRQGGVLAILKE